MEKHQPVLFYYSPVKKGNEIKYVSVIPVLNDKYLGKIIPAQYFAAAEKTKRIETLNINTLKRVSQDIAMHAGVIFIADISVRMLAPKINDTILEIISGKENNIVLAFNKIKICEAGRAGAKALSLLKDKGVRVMVYGVEYGSVKGLNDISADIIRLDGRLYNENAQGAAMLELLNGYAKGRKAEAMVSNVDSANKLDFMKLCKMELLQGNALFRPKRNINSLFAESAKP